MCYELGRGVAMSPSTALKRYRKAAATDSAARTYVAIWEELGYRTDVLRDVRTASQRNSSIAQCALGWVYQFGIGVTRDEKAAVDWCRKAADLQGRASLFKGPLHTLAPSVCLSVDWLCEQAMSLAASVRARRCGPTVRLRCRMAAPTFAVSLAVPARLRLWSGVTSRPALVTPYTATPVTGVPVRWLATPAARTLLLLLRRRRPSPRPLPAPRTLTRRPMAVRCPLRR
jgi:hypothetical protein